MASASTSSIYQCPVCMEDFSQPKILPCAHRICRKCIVSWIGKGGGQNTCPLPPKTECGDQSGGKSKTVTYAYPPGHGKNAKEEKNTCPLCRAPVLSSTQSQSNIAALVDALPTDLAIVSMVKSHEILQGPHICTTCQNDVTATSYCFECEVKLCTPCTSHHQILPALKKHKLEQLNKLTEKQLADNCRSICKTHPDDSAKVYCPAHQEVMCMLCASTTHGNCADKKMIDEVAGEKRRELKRRAHRLREMERDFARQIEEDKSDALLSRAKNTFDDLQQCLEKRRQEVYEQIQARKDVSMTSLRELERLKTALASNAASVENLVDSAPEAALLSMLKNMQSRLDDLESQSRGANKVEDFILDSQKLTQLKTAISTLGRIGTLVITPKPKPSEAELARVLLVGDQVKPGPDWGLGFFERNSYNWGAARGKPGTVIAFPSRIRAGWGWLARYFADVRWDNGYECSYRMGFLGKYHLDLV